MAVPPNAMTNFVDNLRVHAVPDLVPIVNNIKDVYNNQLPNGYLSVYTMSNSIVSTGFTVATPTLVQGSGLGLSLATNLFTLTAGIWEVKWHLWMGGAATASMTLGICTDTAASIVAAQTVVAAIFPSISGTSGPIGAISAELPSSGAATVSFKCFASGAVAATPVLSRITLCKESSS